MKMIKQWERLMKLHKLIKFRKTGPPGKLAKKLGVSDREIYRMLEYLKSHDVQIDYSRKMESYYYIQQIDFNLTMRATLSIDTISKDILNIGNC